jgi:hypothetical protein
MLEELFPTNNDGEILEELKTIFESFDEPDEEEDALETFESFSFPFKTLSSLLF